jgi:hypothetical protein
LQGAPEMGKLLDGERLSARERWDAGGFEGPGDLCRGELGGAEIVGESLALLGEGLLQESDEWAFNNAKFGKTGGEVPAEDGGVDFRGRVEGFGRQGEEGFGAAVELQGDGEEAVFTGARFGGDAVGYFALDHEYCAVKYCVARCSGLSGEAKQDGRGDVVGQVADDEEWLGRCGVGFGGIRGCRGEIELKDVLSSDRDVGYAFFGGETLLEVPGEFSVEFDGDQVFGFGGEMVGDGPFAGSDFDDRARTQVAESRDDALDGLLIAEEVLSELWFTGHVSRFGDLDSGFPPLGIGRVWGP